MRNGQLSETASGYLLAILGALCAGSIPSLAKILLVDNGPIVVTGFSFVLSGVLLLFYRPRARPPRKSLPYLLFFGLVGAGAAPVMYTVGLAQTTAVNASLLANSEVLFTTVIAFGVFGERLTRSEATRGLLIVLGIVIVSTNLDLAHVQFLQGLFGNVLILASMAGWAVENNILAVATKKFDVTAISKFRNLIGGLALVVAILVMGFTFSFRPYELGVLVLLALAVSGGTYLSIAAIKRLGAIRMLLVFSISTIFGAVFALIILGERITLAQTVGGVCILLGVYLFGRSEKPMFVP